MLSITVFSCRKTLSWTVPTRDRGKEKRFPHDVLECRTSRMGHENIEGGITCFHHGSLEVAEISNPRDPKIL
jgi:hypothetical protein